MWMHTKKTYYKEIGSGAYEITLRGRESSLWLRITFASQLQLHNMKWQSLWFTIANSWEDSLSEPLSFWVKIAPGVGNAHNRAAYLTSSWTQWLDTYRFVTHCAFATFDTNFKMSRWFNFLYGGSFCCMWSQNKSLTRDSFLVLQKDL